jgi:hypothetical protein
MSRRALALLLVGGLGAWAGAIVGAPAFASGATSGSPGAAGATGVWCPTFGRRVSTSGGKPVELTPGVGSRQSTTVATRFPIPLSVTVTNADGNPVPRTAITFSAPTAGASGRFTLSSREPHHRALISYAHTVTVMTDACGIAVAPPLTANDTQGGYIVEAAAKHIRPAAFALVNEAP